MPSSPRRQRIPARAPVRGGGDPKRLLGRAMRASQPAASASPASSSHASRRKSAAAWAPGASVRTARPTCAAASAASATSLSPNGSPPNDLDRPDKPLARERAGTASTAAPTSRRRPAAPPRTQARRRADPALRGCRRPRRRAPTPRAQPSGRRESPSSPTNPDRDELGAERLGRAGGDRGERRPQLTARATCLAASASASIGGRWAPTAI